MAEISLKTIKALCEASKISWTKHANQRMVQRNISPIEVIESLMYGEIVEQYPTDTPFSSCLMLAWVNSRPLHVVCSIGKEQIFIITAYEPNLQQWETSFKSRIKEDKKS